MQSNRYPGRTETKTPRSETARAFAEAKSTILQMTQDPRFHARLLAQNIDPYDQMCTERYWTTFATFASGSIARAEAAGADSMHVHAVELLSAVPEFVYKQQRLSAIKNKSLPKGQEKRPQINTRAEKINVSTFNAHIRKFAEMHPDASVSTVTDAMVKMTEDAIEKPHLQKAAERDIKASVQGAKYELVLGQTLDYTNRRHEEADVTMDLAGVDRLVESRHEDKTLYVDAKASRFATRGEDFAFRDGVLVLAPFVEPEAFGDSFYVPDHVAASKATALDNILKEAEGL